MPNTRFHKGKEPKLLIILLKLINGHRVDPSIYIHTHKHILNFHTCYEEIFSQSMQCFPFIIIPILIFLCLNMSLKHKRHKFFGYMCVFVSLCCCHHCASAAHAHAANDSNNCTVVSADHNNNNNTYSSCSYACIHRLIFITLMDTCTHRLLR